MDQTLGLRVKRLAPGVTEPPGKITCVVG